mmetsp:Transcript_176/g.425  ORF Transcript_176/g.425 Transcript_176/m.425 type:complete len:256 (+) Transcript_176:272-1039(+)
MILLHPSRLVNRLDGLALHIRSLPLEPHVRNLRRHAILVRIVHVVAPPRPRRHGIIIAKVQCDLAHVLKSAGGPERIIDGTPHEFLHPLMRGRHERYRRRGFQIAYRLEVEVGSIDVNSHSARRRGRRIVVILVPPGKAKHAKALHRHRLCKRYDQQQLRILVDILLRSERWIFRHAILIILEYVPASVRSGFVEASYAGEVDGRAERCAEGGVGVVGLGVFVIVAVAVAVGHGDVVMILYYVDLSTSPMPRYGD